MTSSSADERWRWRSGGGGTDGAARRARAGHPSARPAVLDLWAAGKTAFGVFVPDENHRASRSQPRARPCTPSPAAQALAKNPLIDFVFLNLEGSYDRNAVMAISEGLGKKGTPGRKRCSCAFPRWSRRGPLVTGQRIKEILAMGADGVTLPHVENLDQGRQAVSLFADARANVWSAANPTGTVVAMLMLEDPRRGGAGQGHRRHRRLQRARLRHRQPDRRAQRRPRGGGEAAIRRSWPRPSG